MSGMFVTLAGAAGRAARGPANPGGRVMDPEELDATDGPGAPGVPGGLSGAGGLSGPGVLERDKAALRRSLLAARALLTPEQRAAAGRAIRDAVLSLPEAQMAGTVAAYYSVATEPDSRGLVYALWKRGTYVLLPVLLADGDLDWASYEGPDSLRPGPRGLTEPPRGVLGIASADLVLLPAMAVDRHGWRLGRGGGSYDRALTRVGSAI